MKELTLAAMILAAFAVTTHAAPTVPDPATMPEIKAYCLDFNWQGSGRRKKIADPGFMKDADPKAVVEWHKAIERCWKTIRKAAKDANPNCIVWLTCNQIKHPHIINSDMFREVDWLMAETGDNKALKEIRDMVGAHTRLITCLAAWNNADPAVVIPEAQANGIGLYGFCAPGARNGTIPLDRIFNQQLSMLAGDDRNIAALARAYHGKSLESVWNASEFVEPENPPAFRLRFPGRGRGLQDIGGLTVTAASTIATIRTHYDNGEATLLRIQDKWPATLIRLERRTNQTSEATAIEWLKE